MVVFASFVFMTDEKIRAQYTEGSERSKTMAAETAKYIQDSKIAFKGSRSEFYSNKNEQIYILSSESNVNVNTVKPPKRIIAVINHKADNKDSGFYVIESEFQRDSILYSVKRGAEVSYTISVKMIKPGPGGPNPGDPFCDKIKQDSDILLAQVQKDANTYCIPLKVCIPICLNSQVIGYSMMLVSPQDYACITATDNNQYQFKKMVESVLDNDVSLFTFSNVKTTK